MERVVLNALAEYSRKLSWLIFAPSAIALGNRLQRSRSIYELSRTSESGSIIKRQISCKGVRRGERLHFASAVDTSAATTLRSSFACTRHRIHLRHRHARHARAGIDRAGVAEIDFELSRRQCGQRGKLAWNFRHSFRTDAVFLFTGAGRFVR